MIDQETTTKELDRRKFLTKAGIGVAGFAAGSAIIAACGSGDDAGPSTTAAPATTAAPTTTSVALASGGPELEWEMGTSWPTALVTLFGSAQMFGKEVGRLTDGRFKINVRPAGEIVGGLEVLPTVRDRGMEMGHTADYYWVGLSPVHQLSTAVPFGLTQRQHNAWLYMGGGLEALRRFYAEEHNLIFFPCGGTGVQMGGWFTKEINTVDDIRGLKMRIPGISGKVFAALGGEQISIAGGEILPAIETGAIDAAEFVGPTDDLILGLDQFAGTLYYYHPGWWEPGTSVNVLLSLDLWNELPPQYQAAIDNAATATNLKTTAMYDNLNQRDLQKVKEFAQIREFSPELMKAFKAETEIVLNDVAAGDAAFAEIYGPWKVFRDGIAEWHGLAERSYLMQQTA